MSGIYIPGMEMPKSCDKCLYSAWSNFYQIYVCNAIRKDEPILFDGKQVKSTAVARSGIADNCPLVPVPEHGRLIDASELDVIGWSGIPKGRNDTFDSGVLWLSEQIDELPTIIPADKEGEG